MITYISIDDIKVSLKFQRKKSKNLLARASVTFCGVVETHGWTISRSEHMHPDFQEPIWVQPPRVRAGAHWAKTVWVTDKSLWREIEAKIYSEYNRLKADYETDEIEEEEDKSIEPDF